MGYFVALLILDRLGIAAKVIRLSYQL